ncbi:MAG: ubiquinone/menaquinone biosynthesis C-methylase UbiE [Chlamydiales bacterium]|jgi:ubiquinone/menaquinone biosynthesis C-methylase UbiE
MKTRLAPGPRAVYAASLLTLISVAACASTNAPTEEISVKPGINDSFLAQDLDVDNFVERFEGESREIFAQREALAAAVGLEPGQVIADVGAGTGPFIGLFADAVGEQGKVFALDIAPRFVEHLAQRAADQGQSQIEARLCSETSVELPANSIDVAFICDVYHHFEFPRTSMASLALALREGGEVVMVDFERIPGVTREWLLNHVRAGKAEVIAELDDFGFEFVEEIQIEGLEENWVIRFRKR